MKALHVLFTGWPALFAFIVSPTVVTLLAPHDSGEWKRWLLFAPLASAYVWLTWPGRSSKAD